ncbi:MAG: rRNA maturation RNase YbeY [Eggerthellaceae bacterium]|jgi:probable rRNA maturation factor|nr:rRNA maturation RNase YbeY [Eggerthellaceae bacterium]MCH4221129.1 rRNA maturation RNase YbeY [Eggerthellaceae bacterium]
MDITIVCDYRSEDIKGLPLEDLAVFVLRHEQQPDTTEVSITFVPDDRIASLNHTYRNVDGPTDVLSFECDGFDDDFDDGHSEDEPFELGDIIIAPDVADRQKSEYGTSFAEEIETLLTHGLLHLCGHDHQTDREAEQMLALQDALLDEWKVTYEARR